MTTSSAPSAQPPSHPEVRHGRVGVLLVNLGTPDGTDVASVRRYLREFLSDRRVIELNPLIWQPILHAFVLTFRPSKSAEAYRAIWLEEENESPLRKYTRNQASLLQDRLPDGGQDLVVDWAMRYGKPSIAERLEHLKKSGCDRVLLFALYPQYSATTTASVHDKAFEALGAMRWQPALRTVPPYHDDPDYIEALARSIETHLEGLGWKPDAILASFHGLPKVYLEKGDPYHCHCAKTARLLRERLGLDEKHLRLTFQSRFGKQEWLQPYTDKTLEALAGEGVKSVAVVCPGFVSDCVETLEEIAIQGRELFLDGGGERFSLIPCLNDSEASIDLLAKLVERELQGWLPATDSLPAADPKVVPLKR
ncbi:MAG: ferrochelatase [Kiloniellales bacterium]|nr:ferrochelatase [Kiloniellales bacterium]